MSRVTRASMGQQSIYNNPLPIQGGSFQGNLKKGFSTVSRANQFAKQNKLVTKGSDILGILGADKFLDNKTGGLYSKAVTAGKQAGYGKKKKRKSTKKKK